MKFLLAFGLFLFLAATGLVVSVSADYKPETKQEVSRIISDFYNQDRGNRVTEYSARGLLQKIDQTFDGLEVISPPSADPPPPAPVPVPSPTSE